MKECFSFRFFESDQDKRSSLVIFFSTEISLDSAVKALKKDVEESLVLRMFTLWLWRNSR